MSPTQHPPVLNPERLAYWYFRLNGFLTTENFIVHPDTGTNQRTDADLLAVRFAGHIENMIRPMTDDPRVTRCDTLANIVIAEVKTGPCALNGPWTNRDAGNVMRVLKWIGCVPDDAVERACDALYGKGHWFNSVATIRLFAVGESRVDNLPIAENQQLTWDEIIEFCVERFTDYEREKSSVGNWTEDGRQLRAYATRRNPAATIRNAFGLRTNRVLAGGT